MKVLLVHHSETSNHSLGYTVGWPKYIQRSNLFRTWDLNLAHMDSWSRRFFPLRIRWEKPDVILVLHSAFSNTCLIEEWLIDSLAASGIPIVYILGNEYKLMPEKMAVCERLNVRKLLTMSSDAHIRELYKGRLGCEVISFPNAGYDPEVIFLTKDFRKRSMDLGYRAFASPYYLGHDERSEIGNFFLKSPRTSYLKRDISFHPKDRLGGPAWNSFLNGCRGQLGTEAGGDYFDLEDRTRIEVNAFMNKNPDVPFETIREKFFSGQIHKNPLRCISGRISEAAATKSVQILFEGHYSGIFSPDQSYISLKKNFSNIEEVLEKFADDEFCARIVENSHAIARDNLTYEKLVVKLYEKILVEES